MKFFSMFSGVGGFEEGIKKAIPDAEAVGYSEIDKYACMVLKKHYPEVKNYGNAFNIRTEELGDFDLLCGGFPCQTFSIAGKRLGFNDTRGTLFFEIARIIKDKRPSILLLENVKGLLNHQAGQTFKVIIATLDELGYDAEWELLNSKYFGVPQNRERIFIVGHLRGQSWKPIFPLANTNKQDTRRIGKEISNELNEITVGKSQGSRVYDTEGISCTLASQAGGLGAKTGLYEIKQKMEDAKKRWGDHYKIGEDISPTLMAIGECDVARIIIPTQIGNSKEFGNAVKGPGDDAFTLRSSEPNGIIVHSLQTRSADRPSLQKNPHGGGSGHIQKEDEAYCLDTGNTMGIQQEHQIRRLTPKECERLQSFPDDWTKYGINEEGEQVDISDSQRYRMMGNAVTCNVVAEIVKRLVERQ